VDLDDMIGDAIHIMAVVEVEQRGDAPFVERVRQVLEDECPASGHQTEENAMSRSRVVSGFVLVLSVGVALGAGDRPLTPVEGRKKVGERITVEMTVRAAKDRLERRGEIYLDSEPDFRDDKNFAVVITKTGAASLKDAGITDPAEHFKAKAIRATGTVKVVEQVPRIEIDDAKQIKIVAR
jgi:hypothetical protein